MASFYRGMREGDRTLAQSSGRQRCFPRGVAPAIVKTADQRESFRRHMAARADTLTDAAPAPGTTRAKKYHYVYWVDFCDAVGIDVDAFAAQLDPSSAERGHEEDALTGLLIFVSEFPRARSKRRARGTPAGRNSSGYAADVASSVRLWYEARRGGLVGLRSQPGQSCPRYKVVRKALAKAQPQARPPRRPVLPQHMHRLRAVLDMGKHEDRTFWCLALSCWVGVRRVGDWLADDAEVAGPWDPARRSHRARVTVTVRPDGVNIITVLMKPPKEDPEGRDEHRVVFATGPIDEALSAGNAWEAMLTRDPNPRERETDPRTPIFRRLPSGREVTKTDFRRWCTRKFAAAGLPEFRTQMHSFRIGGATTLGELAGESAARGVGVWRSDAMLRYIHMSDDRRLALGAAMARSRPLEFAPDSQPIDRRG